MHPSQVAAFINAASLALLRATSIPLRTTVCAVAVGRSVTGDVLFVDPSPADAMRGSGVFVFDGTDALIWSSWSGSPLDAALLTSAIDLARSAASELRRSMRAALSGQTDSDVAMGGI